jgi:hypothetical protein
MLFSFSAKENKMKNDSKYTCCTAIIKVAEWGKNFLQTNQITSYFSQTWTPKKEHVHDMDKMIQHVTFCSNIFQFHMHTETKFIQIIL